MGVGYAPTAKAEHALQDDLTEALKRTQHRSQIWHTAAKWPYIGPRYGQHSPKMGPDCLKMWQHRPHTVSKRERERETETETETDRERRGRERERERQDQPYTDPSGPAPGC